MRFNIFKRKPKPEIIEVPAVEPLYSVCPDHWLKLVHHVITDPAGGGWLMEVRPDQAPLIRRGVQQFNPTDEEIEVIASMLNQPYSELVFGASVTPNDLRYALSQKYKTESK